MKYLIASVLFIVAISTASASLKCQEKDAEVPQEWIDMTGGCIKEVERQIQEEINASIQYLTMAAHFSQDTVNRPGFAEFFFKAAGEEREHATKLIEYLLMRGQLTKKVTNLIVFKPAEKSSWTSGVEALKDALRLEAFVTKSIKQVIEKCQDDNKNDDFHLVDYLIHDYLEEQYSGQRELAGKVSTLDKLMAAQGPLGEFLYDKKLLD